MNDSTKRRAAQALLTLIILAVGALGAKTLVGMREAPHQNPPERVAPLVETIVARRAPIALEVQAQGTVVPHTESRLMAEVAGSLLEVAPQLRAGESVAAGQVLARIDDSDYRLALAESRAALAQAELRLEQTQADAESARRDWERSGTGEASSLVLRVPQLADAKAQLELAEARLEKAQRDVERCSVRAPFAGRITRALVDRGQFVARGAELATLIATDVLEVRIPLPDSELAFLDLPLVGGANLAQAPLARLSAMFGGQERTWTARIVRTEAELDPSSRMIVAVARVEDPLSHEGEGNVPLAVGMFVDVAIQGRTWNDKLALPREALRGTGRVFVVDDEDRLSFRGVEVLRRTGTEIVLGTGVSEGERIVVSPLEAPMDGMHVRPVESRQ